MAVKRLVQRLNAAMAPVVLVRTDAELARIMVALLVGSELMRFKSFNKDSLINLFFGVSEDEEKRFGRTHICIQEGGKIYRVLSLIASKNDGSISVFFNYCKEKRALVMRHKRKKTRGLFRTIDKTDVTGEFEMEFDVDTTAKLSLHRSGFVQLSGKGIVSGVDPKTGKPKGVGVFSSPLDTPVSSGPTFGFGCWGLDKGFELLQKQETNSQYIILNKSDFTARNLPVGDPKSYVLEFFIFPKEANEYVYVYKGKPYINHIIDNYYHQPGAVFSHSVIDLKNFDGVICVFPALQYTGLREGNEFGYTLGSPGGADSQFDEEKSGYSFHVICPWDGKMSMLGIENVGSLEYKSS